jgi:hypothetical protein
MSGPVGSVFDMDDFPHVPGPPSVEVRFFSGVYIDLGRQAGSSESRRRWSVETSTDPAVVAVRRANRSIVDAAVQCAPSGGADVVAHHARVQAKLSVTRTRAETYTDIGLLCERMPRLKACLRKGILSIDHLRLLARSVDGIRHEDTAQAEKALLDILTPRRDGQQVPGPRTLFKKVVKAVHGVDEQARPIDHTDPDPPVVTCADMIPVGDDAVTPDVEPPAVVDPRDCGTLTRRVSVDTYDPTATVIWPGVPSTPG